MSKAFQKVEDKMSMFVCVMQDDMEILQENQEKLLNNVNSLRYRMKNMEANHERMFSMLSALLKHHKVDFEDEDVTVEDSANN